MRLRDWYTTNFPSDELGIEIDDTATFDGLFETLDRRRDVYDYIGVYDSVVRERLFEKLAELAEMPYSYIYDQWFL
jgi:hypothetical protein